MEARCPPGWVSWHLTWRDVLIRLAVASDAEYWSDNNAPFCPEFKTSKPPCAELSKIRLLCVSWREAVTSGDVHTPTSFLGFLKFCCLESSWNCIITELQPQNNKHAIMFNWSYTCSTHSSCCSITVIQEHTLLRCFGRIFFEIFAVFLSVFPIE